MDFFYLLIKSSVSSLVINLIRVTKDTKLINIEGLICTTEWTRGILNHLNKPALTLAITGEVR